MHGLILPTLNTHRIYGSVETPEVYETFMIRIGKPAYPRDAAEFDADIKQVRAIRLLISTLNFIITGPMISYYLYLIK